MIKLICTTTHEGAEIISDLIYDYSRSGVVVEDKEDVAELWNSELVWDYVEEDVLSRPAEVTVIGYYDGEYSEISEDLDERFHQIIAECPFVLPLKFSAQYIQETDWTEDWKKFYKIIEIGDIKVVPIWKKDEVTDGTIVYINPGSAFGTGEHESTRLCLSLMNDIEISGSSVVDTGCGSGILGIAALRLGAKECLFRDIDSSALNNLRENLFLNNVSGDVEQGSLLQGLDRKYDLVLANITADILYKMENAGEVVKVGGHLIMSGIIDKYEVSLTERFLKMGFVLEKRETDGIWVGLLLKKV